MQKECYVVQVLNYGDGIEQMKVHLSLEGAAKSVRAWLFKQATHVVLTCNFSEDYKQQEVAKAHKKYDNLEIKLDVDGEFTYWLSGSYAERIMIRKSTLHE